MRTIATTLLTAQTAVKRTPYIKMLFTLAKTATTIAFVSATKKITDSGSGLTAFKTGDTIVVTGSVSNNGTYTIATGGVAAEIVVNETLVNENAGASVTITETRDLSLDSAAYGNRILLLDHAEEAYNDYAVILLRNNDKGLPAIKGYWTQIGYGDTTAGGNEYAGDGSNGGSLACPRLWVKSQQDITAGGKVYTILELEGMWTRLGETLVRLGNPPFYIKEYTATTAYAIIEILIETEMSWTLDALGAQDDSIINTLPLTFDINSQPFEYMASVIYRLIRGTKCLLRPRAGLNFQVLFPQSGDAVNLTFNSDSAPYFYKYTNRDSILVPNRIYTYGNAGADGAWASYVTGDESDSTSVDAYTEIPVIRLAPDLTTEANVDKISAALLSKVKAQAIFGMGTVPHHCAVELLDKLSFIDNRVSASTYPSDGTVRVGGLRHIYKPGSYTLDITMGGVSISGDIARSIGTQDIVFTDAEEKAITPTQAQDVGYGLPRPAFKPPVPAPPVDYGPSGYGLPLEPAPRPSPRPSPPSPEITLIPTTPGLWVPREPAPTPAPQPTIPEAAIMGVQAGWQQAVVMPTKILWSIVEPVVRPVVKAVTTAVSAVTSWFKGLFGW